MHTSGEVPENRQGAVRVSAAGVRSAPKPPAEKAEYKSARRSRALIRKALVELLQEKDINKITITDIVRRADINRGTFYAHYADVYTVVDQIENELIAKLHELLEVFQSNGLLRRPLPVLKELARYLEEDIEYYRMLINAKGAQSFLERIKQLFIDKMMTDERSLAKVKDKDRFQVALSFFAGGMVEVYKDWLQGKLGKSLDEVAAIVDTMNPYGKGA
ncbi:MAG TPA: TetR/AcrR family transcriptional regulator C-terminal domain-containing protein [Rectinemataceae bacterium]|nr:TetR/AcrR family transcriptional regulator C-terminal domain-containing protein [Rectinemataceae bacterium]